MAIVNEDVEDSWDEGGGVGVGVGVGAVYSLNWGGGFTIENTIRYVKPLHSTARDWLNKYLSAFPGTSIDDALLQALYELPRVIRLRVRASSTRVECGPSWPSR